MHFKPFPAILDRVFFNFFGWVPQRKIKEKVEKNMV